MAVNKLSTLQKTESLPGFAVFEDPISGNIVQGTFTDANSILWKYWIFKSNNQIKCIEPGFADVLVVGGGGTSAPFGAGGGGGGGGVLDIQNAFFDIGMHQVNIGTGAYGTNYTNSSGPGMISNIGPYIALGGGSSTGRYTSAIASTYGGGSGAGAMASDSNTQARITVNTGQGNNGGTSNATDGGGGGGGAGGVGSNGAANTGGNGGVGAITTIITTTIATSASVGQVSGGNLYFGGGGGGRGGTTNGTGGLGGGTSASTTSSTSASPFTGGGAGAPGYNVSFTYAAGNGGSGVVILRVRI